MSSNPGMNYWLFQVNPKIFKLKEALRADALKTAPIKAHKTKIKEGDKVILWQAGKNAACYALAVVKSKVGAAIMKEEEASFYQKAVETSDRIDLEIEYNLWNRPITKETIPNSKAFDEFYAGLPGTNFKATKVQYDELLQLIQQWDALAEPSSIYHKLKTREFPLNSILYGPPGTGKTFETVNYALSIIENRSLAELALEERNLLRKRFEAYQKKGSIAFVTFHQSFSYEDFVEGIKPKVKGEKVVYKVENGIFKNICKKALKAKKKGASEKFVFIIDEINRGNVAAIFGELITLLEADKRAGKREALSAILPYSKTSFSIPDNLFVLATMNTNDRSVESLDVALRRRFTFVEMLPKPELIPVLAKKPVAAGVDLQKLLLAINERIEVLLDKEYCIGHSYFLNIETLADLKNLFSKKIIPLLQEYFFNDFGKIGLIIGKDFIEEKIYNNTDVFADFEHPYAHDLAEKKVYRIRDMEQLSEMAFVRIYREEG